MWVEVRDRRVAWPSRQFRAPAGTSWGAEGGREPIALFIPRAMSMDVAAQKPRAPSAHCHTREKS